MDACEGMWPAFWMYSGDGPTPGGSKWNELDIFEVYHVKEYGEKKWNFTSTLHYDYFNDGNQESKKFVNINSNDLDEWHTYTCYFTETKISIYIDNILISEVQKYKNKDCELQDETYNNVKELYAWPREMGNLIINLAIQGLNTANNKGDISDNPISAFPCTYEVDYVKYYQKSDCSQHTYAPLIGVGGGTNWTWIPSFTGWNVDILDDAVMESGEHSQLIANTSIETLGNFEVELGANFEAWIDPTLCSLYKSAELTTDLEPETQEMLSRSLNLEINFEINYENQIYPNPFTSELMLEIADEFLGGDYKVYDMLGNLVRTGRLTSNLTSIDGLDQLTLGIYSIVISKEDKVEVQKVMKN